MCTKHEVRPGVDGLLDYVDVFNSVKLKVNPLLTLLINIPLSHDGKSNFTDDEIASLLCIVRDLLDEAWIASDGVYALFKEVKSCTQ